MQTVRVSYKKEVHELHHKYNVENSGKQDFLVFIKLLSYLSSEQHFKAKR